ncbi:MAG TPA: glycerate kinase [Tetrasphaera sp.]|uniref:glycerate kinase family protein n=1 Tax=Nostocoides sp. TaxID=1917966 RepID=UPI002C92BA5E|nr:glycerate kinase [Tetrasphaera sp.]HNQ07242.1 glycerate kinase [Tetrasphaera sp.]
MHVVIAPDCFTGTLTATQAAEAIADGWAQTAPHCVLTRLPLSDGGPGFLDVLAAQLDGEMIAATVADPLGRPVPANVLVVDAGGERTAYVESAQAAGLHLLGAGERNPAITSTYGVGQLLLAARATGARRIVVGLGGSGTNDGGAGMLAALGAGSIEDLGRGGLPLADLGPDALGALTSTIAEWSDIDLLAATDVDSPLLGLQGTSAVFGPQKGASPQLAQDLESALGHFADRVRRHLPGRLDLLTGKPLRLDREPGAGAAGGLAYGLLILGARRVSGVDLVLAAVDFAALAAAADLVVTGEGCFDWQSLRGKVVAGVAECALAAATPTIVIAGQALVGRRESMGIGLSGVYAVAGTPAQEEAAMTDPVGTLRARAARVAATWSPPPRP